MHNEQKNHLVIKTLAIITKEIDILQRRKGPLKVNGNSVRKFLSCPEAIHIPVR